MITIPQSYIKDYKMTKEIENLYKEFINEYDDKNLEFNNIGYRKGAKITGRFCLEEGFKEKEDGNIEWGYVRIHSGVDRGRGQTVNNIKNVIFAPFNFESSRFEDYNGNVYGTLVILLNEKYGFEFRIAHMFPDEILIINDLMRKKPIKRNTIIGPAGYYGVGSGTHTHTEVKSIKETTPILELILDNKFGNQIYSEYSIEDIIEFYKKQPAFKEATFEEISKDWKEQKVKRNCFFANKFLYRYVDFDGTKKTRYSTELLWNGL